MCVRVSYARFVIVFFPASNLKKVVRVRSRLRHSSRRQSSLTLAMAIIDAEMLPSISLMYMDLRLRSCRVVQVYLTVPEPCDRVPFSIGRMRPKCMIWNEFSGLSMRLQVPQPKRPKSPAVLGFLSENSQASSLSVNTHHDAPPRNAVYGHGRLPPQRPPEKNLRRQSGVPLKPFLAYNAVVLGASCGLELR